MSRKKRFEYETKQKQFTLLTLEALISNFHFIFNKENRNVNEALRKDQKR